MLGKKRSVPAVRRIMKELNIMQTSVYEMCQGRVMRWGFAWTFIPNFQFPVSKGRNVILNIQSMISHFELFLINLFY